MLNTIPDAFMRIGFLVAALGIYFLFIFRPQQKKLQEQNLFFNQIKPGDYIITIGGIHGRIVQVQDDIIVLETDKKGNRLTMDKAAISLEASKKYIKK